MNDYAVQMKGIVKYYGDFLVNDYANFSVKCGEVHAILGENGSGKTTLVSILCGVKSCDSGDIYLYGNKVKITSPQTAKRLGIVMVSQHTLLISKFSVLENVILGNEPRKWGFFVDFEKAREKVLSLMRQYEFDIDIDLGTRISDFSLGVQQLVAILRALYVNPRILILDEPTSLLSPDETRTLVAVVKALRERGVSIIVITHKIQEVQEIVDRCTVIKNGRTMEVFNVNQMTRSDLTLKMAGYFVRFETPECEYAPGSPVLQVCNLSSVNWEGKKVLDRLSFSVYEGEVLGVLGSGSYGSYELVEVFLGVRSYSADCFFLNHQCFKSEFRQTTCFLKDLAIIPSDRNKYGLVLECNIAENLVLKSLSKRLYSRWGFLDREKICVHAQEMIKKFNIYVKDSNPYVEVQALSGGNQQKVLLARELSDPNVCMTLVNNPNQGLDLKSSHLIYEYFLELRQKRKTILLISRDIDEVLQFSDRVLIMDKGCITHEFFTKNVQRKDIEYAMSAGKII